MWTRVGFQALTLVLLVVGPRTSVGYKLLAASVCVWMLGQCALTFGRGGVYNFATGAIALLAVDAWQVQAALELAARGGGALEAFDAVA